MRRGGWAAGLVVALLAAEGAALLLRPRDAGPAPAPVSASAYFTDAQLDRARAFRRPQLALGLGALAVELAALGLLVARPPRRLRTSAWRRPLVATAATGAAVSVLVTLAPLPVRAVARERARDVGLVTQSWPGWAGDLTKSTAISAGLAGGGAVLGVVLMRRFGRRWWIPGAGVVVVVAAGFLYAGPVVLDPLFNRFEPLPEGRTRSDVLALARRAGIEADTVEVVDASRRTTAANAYVAGLGSTKRVVLYDTLLERFPPEELRLVVAHELGHVHHHDLRNGLLYVALVAPFGAFAVARLTARLAPRGAPPGPAVVPALVLSLTLVSTGVTWVSNSLSRQVERRADAFSLRLTGDPRTFVAFERRITLRNVSDPDPPRLPHVLLGTHPTIVERIGMAEAWAGGAR